MMSADNPASGSLASAKEVEPIRVLVPSRLGNLGVEFVHTAITRLVFAPTGKERTLFFPFADYEDSEFLDEVFGRISEYLAGVRRILELEYDLTRTGLDGFARRVLRETARTPYGRTRNYKEIAEASGRPDSYRQVVSILERNPLPLLIPCHRILPSRQGVGGYVGGPARKKALLKLEREATREAPPPA